MVLKDAKGILDELQAYKGAGAEIREVRLTLPHIHLSGTRSLHEFIQMFGLHLDVLFVVTLLRRFIGPEPRMFLN